MTHERVSLHKVSRLEESLALCERRRNLLSVELGSSVEVVESKLSDPNRSEEGIVPLSHVVFEPLGGGRVPV